LTTTNAEHREQDDHDGQNADQSHEPGKRPDLVAHHLRRAICRRGAPSKT